MELFVIHKPNAGGTAIEFQKMQVEYKKFPLSLQQKHTVATPSQKTASAENELINELGKLAKVLLKNQVLQNFLRQKMQTTKSPTRKGLFGDIANLEVNFK